MPRRPQGAKPRGSQRWLQIAVNRCPSVIDSAIRSAGVRLDDPIVWASPLESDDFAEYMDAAFLRRLGVRLDQRRLADFWPRSGPRWDALGRSGDSVLLVEAKANIRELNSSPCGAEPDSDSFVKIRKALMEVRAFLNVNSDTDWTRCFYQYANRLAHLYLLRELNGCDAYLVFLYFVGDQTTAPASQGNWHGAIALAEAHLGLPKSEWMSRYVKDVYIDTVDLSHVGWPS